MCAWQAGWWFAAANLVAALTRVGSSMRSGIARGRLRSPPRPTDLQRALSSALVHRLSAGACGAAPAPRRSAHARRLRR